MVANRPLTRTLKQALKRSLKRSLAPIIGAAALGAAVLVGVTACSPAAPPVGATLPATTLPDGVEVSVYQSRSDYSAGIIDVRILNGSDAALELATATLATTQFASPTSWDRGTTLAAGATVDLRLDLPSPVCPTPDDAEPRVTIAFESAGVSGEVTVVADDPIATLEKLSTEECISFAAAVHADIEAASAVRWTPGAGEPAGLDITVTPTAADGSLTIERANATVLLALAGEGGRSETTLELGTVVDADAKPSVIPLHLVPSRCDPHAVAEDKRGTFFPLVVSTAEGESGTMFVPVSDEVRVSLYEFVQDYCGY